MWTHPSKRGYMMITMRLLTVVPSHAQTTTIPTRCCVFNVVHPTPPHTHNALPAPLPNRRIYPAGSAHSRHLCDGFVHEAALEGAKYRTHRVRPNTPTLHSRLGSAERNPICTVWRRSLAVLTRATKYMIHPVWLSA
ncbi:hypothetical protein PF005_g8006 [Phytophthora fragariae]|uniref:Secreted protein n=1 Tax=Phytophthora fragariae TaxID=53985 RepID=A0A6A3SLK6_9STRA|nr:hypothetical protein PF003_g20438 [Phytophthora fragariae]KAE8944682.1 hypothetical protein PF009_g5638 [Phytophthora fragariae]KAE9117310.1 hypothetical protein PF007_g9330 [Phytophthora fragariae]KAE9148058.1 hypothetical protein PF006_g7316 [Phytophthora fragariae]KAE9219109.1 hypothetical protein PF005_g8006 [Phytophthora fragariae]